MEQDPYKGGQFSLKSSLDYVKALLKDVPQYGSREVLLISGALSTCDGGGELVTSLQEVKEAAIRCSVVSLSAEVHVFRLLTHATKGTSRVPFVFANYNFALFVTWFLIVDFLFVDTPQACLALH